MAKLVIYADLDTLELINDYLECLTMDTEEFQNREVEIELE